MFSGFWFSFGLIYALLEKGLLGDSPIYPSTKNPYDFQSAIIIIPIGSAVTGLILGSIEVLLLGKVFIRLSFIQKIIFKTLFYIGSIIIFLFGIGTLTNSVILNLSPFHSEVFDTMKVFFFNFAFWSVIIYSVFFISISLFIIEVSEYLGLNVFRNYLTGRYHQPREEERIFMFLDMKSSTTIAEELGHLHYYDLLNQYYADITDAIINTYGEFISMWEMR